MKSKLAFLLSIFFISFFSFSSSLATDSAMPSKTTMVDRHTQDPVFLGWLVVVNKNEIAISKEALKRKLNEDVKQYAMLLESDHSKNLKEEMKLSEKLKIKPMKTAKSEDLKKQGEEVLKQFKKMDDQAFQVAFINGMVKGHEGALKEITQDVQEATNPEIKAFLEKTRGMIEEHLQKGKAIQDKMKSTS